VEAATHCHDQHHPREILVMDGQVDKVATFEILDVYWTVVLLSTVQGYTIISNYSVKKLGCWHAARRNYTNRPLEYTHGHGVL
jgi:hypothetical protein